MTVRELAELYIEGDEQMEVRDRESEKTVFIGTFDEATICECSDKEVRGLKLRTELL